MTKHQTRHYYAFQPTDTGPARMMHTIEVENYEYEQFRIRVHNFKKEQKLWLVMSDRAIKNYIRKAPVGTVAESGAVHADLGSFFHHIGWSEIAAGWKADQKRAKGKPAKVSKPAGSKPKTASTPESEVNSRLGRPVNAADGLYYIVVDRHPQTGVIEGVYKLLGRGSDAYRARIVKFMDTAEQEGRVFTTVAPHIFAKSKFAEEELSYLGNRRPLGLTEFFSSILWDDEDGKFVSLRRHAGFPAPEVALEKPKAKTWHVSHPYQHYLGEVVALTAEDAQSVAEARYGRTYPFEVTGKRMINREAKVGVKGFSRGWFAHEMFGEPKYVVDAASAAVAKDYDQASEWARYLTLTYKTPHTVAYLE